MLARFISTRRFLKGAVAALALLGLSACEPGVGGGPSIDTSKPIPVALLIPKGSSRSGDAVLAQSLENAARLAIADLSGVSIDLRVYATAADAGTAQQAAIKAVDEGAKIILGPVFAEAANAVGVGVASKGVNVLSFSNNTTIAGGNVFVLGPTFSNTASRLVDYATKHGKSNFMIAHANNVSGQQGNSAISAAINNSFATNAGSVSYEFSQQGVVNAVRKITTTAADTKPDALFLTADTSGALPLFSQLLPEAGMSPLTTQFIGLTRWDIPAQTLALPGVQGGWFAMPDPSLSQKFQTRYAQAYGGLPHPIGGLAYDGIAAIGALAKAGKSNALTGSALTQSAGFQGVNGIFRLRSDGTNERGLAVATIRDKKVVIIDPAPTRFGSAGL
ncbi:penicillin-binding protein activator [Shimia litoralis]|uniref:Penicillin-binding protein activator n=1 Tax=Shimia litoralis TaxID=420403 RepID=A0A4U7NBS3_9RHOB|nr:penicillin-binding protein activator [Shimia litoralis]TKZ22474.1 penicillin-binding protein activator [Shimia litoralis]